MSVTTCDRCGEVTVDDRCCRCTVVADDARDRRPRPSRSPAPHPAAPPTVTVRLRAPLPGVVLARVAGTVDEATAPRLAEQLTALFGGALRIVVDLTDVATLTRAGAQAMLGLDREARGRGTQLHLVEPGPGVRGDGAPRLSRLAADHLVRIAASADAVLTPPAPAQALR